MKNRTDLAKYFNQLGFKNGAEIGACFGRYSEILCKNIPDLKLVAVDNWNNKINSKREAIAKASGEAETRKKLAPYKALVVKKDSLEAAKDIPDESLDFVFIDADHSFSAVKNDLIAWSKKVRRGGIVSGHDYYVFPSGRRGVIDAVDQFVRENGCDLAIIPWDNDNPVPDDRPPVWYFFIK